MNEKKIDSLLKGQRMALFSAMKEVLADLIESETIPFENGILEDEATRLVFNGDEGRVSVVSDADYAARLYFHPEYQFQQNQNKNAGAQWFAPYISGEKKEFILTRYAAALKKANGGEAE
jgi:hypothetical protein